MPPVDHPPPSGTGQSATGQQAQGGKNKKKFDPDGELSGAVGCITPAFFLHLVGTALVVSPLKWGGAGAVLSGVSAVVVFVAAVGPDFHKFKAGTHAYANAHRLAAVLILYGLVTFAASLAVLAPRDGVGALWNAVFCASLVLWGLWVRGNLVGARRTIPSAVAGLLTIVIPLLLVFDLVAFMTYPGVENAALVLSLALIAFWLLCTACNRFRTPGLLVLLLTIVQLLFLAANDHQRSASALWLLFTGEKQTCRLLGDPPPRSGSTFDYGPSYSSYDDDHDYYLCPGEVFAVDRPGGHIPDTTSRDEVMVRDRTGWTTALLRPGEVKPITAARWIVNFGVIVILLLVILVIAVARRGRPDPLGPRTPAQTSRGGGPGGPQSFSTGA